MSDRVVASLAAAVAAMFVVLAQVPVAGQSLASTNAASATKTWTPPRTPDGQPDLQGIWSAATITPLERPDELAGKQVFTDEEAVEFEKQTNARRNQDRRDGAGTDADVGRAYNQFWWDFGTTIVGTKRTSLVVNPPDGRIPAMTPEGQKRAEARAVRGYGSWTDRNLWERCITRGLPIVPGAYNNNYQIVQAPGYVVILHEMIHDARVISFDGRPHISSGIRQYFGDGRGHWEGNTLVVETTNFSPQANFRGSAENLHLIERFTRLAPDTLLYEFTVNDPTTWTKPWTAQVPMPRINEMIYEYACHEGNEGMVGILSGARNQEKAAEEAARKGSSR
jgi:hypothetical protein